MGLWGAAQALAFGLGGLIGTALSDLARLLVNDTAIAYAIVFGLEAMLFIVSARLASRIREAQAPEGPEVRGPAIKPIKQETAHA
jgi:BCD family chlorophyll transporter-like MFS transporter